MVFNDTDEYEIDITFDSKGDIISYLNATFATALGLEGTFTIDGDYIKYSNPESFLKIEIVAILETNVLIFRMGAALEPNKSYTSVSNSNVITDTSLQGIEVLFVQVDSSMRQPITDIGWIHDSILGTLTFPADSAPQDVNIYVTVKQSI
jgi:hypothetical protein